MNHRMRLALLGAGAAILLHLSNAQAYGADEVNVVKRIQTAAVKAEGRSSGPPVEIQVDSTKEFPVRDAVVVLNIGGKEFTMSRSPEDGSLNTLIFTVSASDWASLKSGDSMAVYFGQDDVKNPEARWNFGALDKTLLNKS